MRLIFVLAVLGISLSVNALEVKVYGTKDSYFTKEHVYNGFGCTGKNVIPKIKWKDVPKEAKALAVTIYDPDAPTGAGWWHWLISNISTDFSSVKKDNIEKVMKKGAIESMTSYGKPGFGGPCPPVGDTPHRYVVTVYALKEKVKVNAETTPGIVGFMLNKNAIVKATATLLYGR